MAWRRRGVATRAQGVRGSVRAVRRFIRARPDMVERISRMSQELEDVIQTQWVDCVMSGLMGIGARYAAEHTGRPFVSVDPS
jgi:hypothetical protein